MKIIRKAISDLSPNEIKEIKSFLNLNFCTPFHEPDFNKIVEEVFNTEFSYNLVYKNHGRLIALCPMHAIKSSLLVMNYSNPTMYEVPYGGWIYNNKEVSILDLINLIKLSPIEGLTYWSIPQVESDDYFQIKNKKEFQTAIIDLKTSEDNIWQNCINSKRRNMIRKAKKNNIEVMKVDYSKFEDYFQLMKETYQSADLTIKPKEYYLKIFKKYTPNNKAIILLAQLHSNVISGVVLMRNRHICHYWLGASKKGAENLGQGELLQWEAIKWAKANGSRYYDLCVVEPERLPRIAKFKLGFSNRIVPFYCFSKRKLSYRIISRILRCF